MKEPDIVDRIADHLLHDHIALMNANQAFRQAAEQALEWIEAQPEPRMLGALKTITALRAALAEPTIKESLQVPAET